MSRPDRARPYLSIRRSTVSSTIERPVASDAIPSSRPRTSDAHACCGSLVRSYVRASHGVAIAISGYGARPGKALRVHAPVLVLAQSDSGFDDQRLLLAPSGDLTTFMSPAPQLASDGCVPGTIP